MNAPQDIDFKYKYKYLKFIFSKNCLDVFEKYYTWNQKQMYILYVKICIFNLSVAVSQHVN